MAKSGKPATDRVEGRRHLAGALLLLVSLLTLGSSVQAWELRVCAEPNNLPFSNRAIEGFENRIAEIIAEELGATLSYAWHPNSRISDRLLQLRNGDCDMVVGVADGTEGYLTTIPYYSSAPVFVYREDAPFEVASFDDEILRELRIAVLAGGGVRPEVAALARRDLTANVVSYPFDAEGSAPLAAPVEAVAAGGADVAVVWGPIGSYFGARQEAPLEVVSAEPKVDIPFLNLVVSMTMGVRQNDVALRDLLNQAIVAGWEEIQAVLGEFQVPLEPHPTPAPGTSGARPGMRVGLTLPLPTGPIPLEANAPHEAASAARMGALMAEEELGGRSDAFPGFRLLMSNTPSAASARRAAERMTANGVVALVGGFGDGQAEVLAQVAASRGVPFLNIGSSSRSLRMECSPFTFHVEADAGSYLSALARALSDAGLKRLLVAYPDAPSGERLVELAEEVFVAGFTVVDTVPVSGEQQLIQVALSAREAEAQAIVALLDWRAQLDLAGFLGSVGDGVVLTGFPYPVTQTRTYYYSLQRLGPGASGGPRVALWDASLAEGAAGDLNQSFFARWGQPIDPPGWAAYVSLELIREAAIHTPAGQDLATSLEQVELNLHRGAEIGFDSAHRLRQTLFQIGIEPGAASRQESVAVVRRFAPEEPSVTPTCN